MRSQRWPVVTLILAMLVGGCSDNAALSTVTDPPTAPTTTATAAELAATTVTTTREPDTTSRTAGGTKTTTSNPAQSGSVELEVSFFDWTETNPPSEEAFVVVEGTGSWTPDLEFGGDSHTFGKFVIGVPGTMLIYPDGPDGKEIRVTFVMTDEMISGSAQALTHIEVYDSEVLIFGQAIPDFEQTSDR